MMSAPLRRMGSEMSKEYFVASPDIGIEWFDAIENANNYARILIDNCIDDAYLNGEWPDDVELIRVGVALGLSSEVHQEDGSCDFRIEKSSFQVELDRLIADAADLRRERDELAARLAEIERSEPAEHIYAGDCPDKPQPDARDPLCPACRAMAAVAPRPHSAKPARQPLTDERIDAIADIVTKGMPDGIRGFCRVWGWRQFARALLQDCAGYYRAEPAHDGGAA